MTKRARVPGTLTRERLIPVVSPATETAPTAGEVREVAERFQDLAQSLNPADIAYADQVQAGVRAVEARMLANMESASADLHTTKGTIVAATVLWLAAMRSVEARCRHCDWPPTLKNPPRIVNVTARAATCMRPACTDAMKARWHDDGLCELCEKPSDTFYPWFGPLGPMLVAIALCPGCSALMGEQHPGNG